MPHLALWAYPWDLAEEEIDRTVQALASEVGINAIALACAYHSVEHLRPRAAGKKLFRNDRASVYYQPDLQFYRGTRLRPNVHPLATEDPVLPEFVKACARHGVRPESWTVFLHNSYLGTAFPDCAEVNVYGDTYTHALCPSNPEVRAYAVALCRDLESQGIEIIEMESLSFQGFGHSHHHTKFGIQFGAASDLFGLCFCPHCVRTGREGGIDMELLTRQVKAELDPVFRRGLSSRSSPEMLAGVPGLAAFLEVRKKTITSLLQEIRSAVSAQLNFILMGDEVRSGFDFRAIRQIVSQTEILVYTSSADQVKNQIQNVREQLGSVEDLVVGFSVYGAATPDSKTLLDNICTARECGAQHFSFYNYGIMPRDNLQWVGTALRDSQ